MRLVVVSIVVALAACTTPPEQERNDVATAFCQCLHSAPAAIDACVTDDVLPVLPPMIPDDCLTCVYTNSQRCSQLFSDCVDLCVQP